MLIGGTQLGFHHRDFVLNGMLFLQRGAREIFAPLVHRQLGLALPGLRFCLHLLQAARRRLAVRQYPRGGTAHLHQGVLHFLDDQADHLLRVLRLIQQGVEVGVNDVAHPRKNAHVCSPRVVPVCRMP